MSLTEEQKCRHMENTIIVLPLYHHHPNRWMDREVNGIVHSTNGTFNTSIRNTCIWKQSEFGINLCSVIFSSTKNVQQTAVAGFQSQTFAVTKSRESSLVYPCVSGERIEKDCINNHIDQLWVLCPWIWAKWVFGLFDADVLEFPVTVLTGDSFAVWWLILANMFIITLGLGLNPVYLRTFI